MFPAKFEYHAPSSLDEAIKLLSSDGGDAKVLAGGDSLLPLMKVRLAQPSAQEDIGRMRGLSAIKVSGDAVTIGALTTHAQLEASPKLEQRLPPLPGSTAPGARPTARAGSSRPSRASRPTPTPSPGPPSTPPTARRRTTISSPPATIAPTWPASTPAAPWRRPPSRAARRPSATGNLDPPSGEGIAVASPEGDWATLPRLPAPAPPARPPPQPAIR